MPSRRTARHHRRHTTRQSYVASHRRKSRSRTLGIVAATTAGAAAIAGISLGVSLGASPTRPASQSAPAPAAITTGSASGANRQNHPAAESDSPLDTTRSGTRSPGKSTSRPASGKQSAKPAAATRREAAARPSASASPSSGPSKPYEFYDSVNPQAVPAGAIVATYATGAHPVPTSTVTGRKQVMWIDTLATDPQGTVALDIEPGCATPSQVPGWVASRVKAHPGQVAILYMSLSEWPQIQAEVASLPASTRSLIRWWVADPTGTPHIVPGSSATQWYWGSSYDESMAAPNFDPPLVPGPGA